MAKGGNNRSWGYASYDVDDMDKEELTYTSYEKSGRVNRYTDNGDGGHGHKSWKSSYDYDRGKDPDSMRIESNDSPNPTTGEVQENGGCYLTSACMKFFQDKFNDNCYELTVLRWFRDNFVSKEDIEHYYEVAPIIVDAIEKDEKKELVYDYIYENVVSYCVEEIEKGNYDSAYSRYKSSVQTFENTFAKPYLGRRLIKAIQTN